MEKKRKKQQEKSYPAALTVGVSDSSGSGGIQADLRTFNAFGVYGCSAITAISSQTPAALHRLDLLSLEAVTSQIDAIMSAVNVKYAKNGVLLNSGIIDVICAAVKKYHLKLVCDPVFTLPEEKNVPDAKIIELFKKQLMPLASWLTPNIPAAELLLDEKITSLSEQISAAQKLHALTGVPVIIKGGHGNKVSGQILPKITDVICCDGKTWTVSSLKVDVPAPVMHGIGSTFSAALTAALALDLPWDDAIGESKAFVMGSLVENVRISNHFSAMYPPGNDYTSSILFEEMDVK